MLKQQGVNTPADTALLMSGIGQDALSNMVTANGLDAGAMEEHGDGFE